VDHLNDNRSDRGFPNGGDTDAVRRPNTLCANPDVRMALDDAEREWSSD
jgi:hypothetical protein